MNDQMNDRMNGPMDDRLDFLLSARLDDELTDEERAELEGLLADHPESAARASAFDEIDAGLESLAAESAGDEALTAAYHGLRARLGFEASVKSETSRPSRPFVPLLFAAAAALLFYLVLPMRPPTTGEATEEAINEPALVDLAEDREGDTGLDVLLEDELVLVLGYGEEMSEINGITSDDLDVIEQLDLLDFLSTRELAAGELEGRG